MLQVKNNVISNQKRLHFQFAIKYGCINRTETHSRLIKWNNFGYSADEATMSLHGTSVLC